MRAELDRWREVAVFLSRTRSKMGLSTPSIQEFQSHMGFNYFALHKGGHARLGSILLHLKSTDFIKVILNFAARCLG